jgi:diketogulonate reductase-like aldo/keto reductase
MTRRQSIEIIQSMAIAAFVRFDSSSIIKRKIQSSGEKIPVIGMGTWRTFDVTNITLMERQKIVLQNLVSSSGITIDSSPMYGHSEKVVGELAEQLGINTKMFFATKVWTTGQSAGEQQIEQSFDLLKRKTIDLFQIHNLLDWQTHLKTLRKLKDEGRIRYIGITHYVDSMHETMAEIMVKEKLDFIQVNFNIGNRNAERKLLPIALDNGISVVVNRPFQEGALFSTIDKKTLPAFAKDYGCEAWSQFFLKYIISNPAVTCAIPATSNPVHVIENMKAAYGYLPNAAEREKMVHHWQK